MEKEENKEKVILDKRIQDCLELSLNDIEKKEVKFQSLFSEKNATLIYFVRHFG